MSRSWFLIIFVLTNNIQSVVIECADETICSCTDLQPGESCNFVCTYETAACMYSTLYCAAAHPCSIACNGERSCEGIVFIANTAIDVSIICGTHSTDGCTNAQFDCGIGLCSMDCQGSCDGTSISIQPQTKQFICPSCPDAVFTPSLPTNNPIPSPSNNPISSPTNNPTSPPTNSPTSPPTNDPIPPPTTSSSPSIAPSSSCQYMSVTILDSKLKLLNSSEFNGLYSLDATPKFNRPKWVIPQFPNDKNIEYNGFAWNINAMGHHTLSYASNNHFPPNHDMNAEWIHSSVPGTFRVYMHCVYHSVSTTDNPKGNPSPAPTLHPTDNTTANAANYPTLLATNNPTNNAISPPIITSNVYPTQTMPTDIDKHSKPDSILESIHSIATRFVNDTMTMFLLILSMITVCVLCGVVISSSAKNKKRRKYINDDPEHESLSIIEFERNDNVNVNVVPLKNGKYEYQLTDLNHIINSVELDSDYSDDDIGKSKTDLLQQQVIKIGKLYHGGNQFTHSLLASLQNAVKNAKTHLDFEKLEDIINKMEVIITNVNDSYGQESKTECSGNSMDLKSEVELEVNLMSILSPFSLGGRTEFTSFHGSTYNMSHTDINKPHIMSSSAASTITIPHIPSDLSNRISTIEFVQNIKHKKKYNFV